MDVQRQVRFSAIFQLVFFLPVVFFLITTRLQAEDLTQLQKDPNQWALAGKNYSLTRYSELTQITTANVKDLKPAWTFSTGVLRGHEGAPLVVGDTMYLVTPFPNIVYALDLTQPGSPVKWKYEPKQDPTTIPIACCDVVNRGAAYADGKIFFNQLDAHTVALDAKTGKELWKVQQGDPKQGQTITMAPLVIKDKVISGISGGEFGVRGFVTANDINTGKQVWRAYSTGPDAEVLIGKDFSSLPVAPGKIWGLDVEGRGMEERRRHHLGMVQLRSRTQPPLSRTGNPGAWNADQRPGENKWSMTIFAWQILGKQNGPIK
jgi:alcohol dehydrogenase (cytochrome c)